MRKKSIINKPENTSKAKEKLFEPASSDLKLLKPIAATKDIRRDGAWKYSGIIFGESASLYTSK